jgi:hypothetical protein
MMMGRVVFLSALLLQTLDLGAIPTCEVGLWLRNGVQVIDLIAGLWLFGSH